MVVHASRPGQSIVWLVFYLARSGIRFGRREERMEVFRIAQHSPWMIAKMCLFFFFFLIFFCTRLVLAISSASALLDGSRKERLRVIVGRITLLKCDKHCHWFDLTRRLLNQREVLLSVPQFLLRHYSLLVRLPAIIYQCNRVCECAFINSLLLLLWSDAMRWNEWSRG